MTENNAAEIDASIRFAGTLPTQPIAWAVVGFFVVFLTFMMLASVLPAPFNDDGTPAIAGLIAGMIAGVLIRFWPRPRFSRELVIRPDGIVVLDRRGRRIDISAGALHMIAAEATLEWGAFAIEPWGRLHIRTQDQWVAIQGNPQESPRCYAAMLRNFPHLLGISGRHEVDVPAIGDIGALPDWIDRVRRTYLRESGRQIRFACFYGVLMGAAGIAYLSGVAGAFFHNHAKWISSFTHTSLIGFCFLGGAIAYTRAAMGHIRMRAVVLKDLKRLQEASGLQG